MNGSQLYEQKYATGRIKTWDISTSKVFVSLLGWRRPSRSKRPTFLLFLLRIFAHIIDFRSYVDATMSLYSIIDTIFAQSLFTLIQGHLAVLKFLWFHNHHIIYSTYVYTHNMVSPRFKLYQCMYAYNTVRRSIASILGLSGTVYLRNLALCALVNMSPQVVNFIGYRPPYRTIIIQYSIV